MWTGWLAILLGSAYALGGIGYTTGVLDPFGGGTSASQDSAYAVGGLVGLAVVLAMGAGVIARGLRNVRSAGRQPVTRSVLEKLGVGLVSLIVLGAAAGVATGAGNPGEQDLSGLPAGAWSTQAGVQARRDFVAGCGDSGGPAARALCACLFRRLAWRPDGDSPQRFAALLEDVERARRNGRLDLVPSAFAEAVRLCDDESPARRESAARRLGA